MNYWPQHIFIYSFFIYTYRQSVTLPSPFRTPVIAISEFNSSRKQIYISYSPQSIIDYHFVFFSLF